MENKNYDYETGYITALLNIFQRVRELKNDGFLINWENVSEEIMKLKNEMK